MHALLLHSHRSILNNSLWIWKATHPFGPTKAAKLRDGRRPFPLGSCEHLPGRAGLSRVRGGRRELASQPWAECNSPAAPFHPPAPCHSPPRANPPSSKSSGALRFLPKGQCGNPLLLQAQATPEALQAHRRWALDVSTEQSSEHPWSLSSVSPHLLRTALLHTQPERPPEAHAWKAQLCITGMCISQRERCKRAKDMCDLKGSFNGETLFFFSFYFPLSSFPVSPTSEPERKGASVLSRNEFSLCLFHNFATEKDSAVSLVTFSLRSLDWMIMRQFG